MTDMLFGECAPSFREYVTNRLPGGTIITSDEIVTNVNTVYQQTKKNTNKHKEWEEVTDGIAIVRKESKQTNRKYMKDQQRVAWGKIAVVGTSGSGKSYLSKTADPDTTGYVNVERKPLPYKQEKPFKYMGQPKSWAGYKKCIEDYAANPEIKLIIVDSQTGAFDLLNREMQDNFTGWDIAKYYNKQVAAYLEMMKNVEKDMIILSHDELVKMDDKSSQKRMVVHNKEYEGKLERQYTCVLYTGTRISNGKPQYFLKTFELDSSSKTPEGLFPDKDGENMIEIPNDAKYILEAVQKYYSI